MLTLFKFIHLASAIVWVGGMAFVMLALRPVAATLLPPPQRLPLMAAALGRFFIAVWVSIALLVTTGYAMMAIAGMKGAPLGWHLMMGIGLLMVALFGHIYFVGYKRLKGAVAASDWPAGAKALGTIAAFVHANFALAWLAIAAVVFIK